MRLTLRTIVRGETDPEALALAVIAAALVLGGAWLWLGLPTPACLFQSATGIPCLTCGGTRCARALLAGDWARAASWNPVVFAGFLATGAFLLYAAVVVALRLPRVRIQLSSGWESHVLRVAVAVILAANWIYLIVHFARGA